MTNVTLNVGGMSCGHCVKAIEGGLAELKGVEKVSVDLENAKVNVQFESEIVSLAKIKEAIDDQGYDIH